MKVQRLVKKNIVFVTFAIIAVLFVVLTLIMMQRGGVELTIDSYQKCADAGYPIQESFPARCVTPDGKSFTGPRQ